MVLAFVTAIFIKNRKAAVAKSHNVVAKRSYLFKQGARSEQRPAGKSGNIGLNWKTPFVFLYGMASWSEDFAELATIYHLTKKMNQPSQALKSMFMFFESTINKHKLQAFVKEIFLLENQQVGIKPERLSFYADGFPGLVFLQTEAPVYQLPKGKLLSSLFIYGQTIHPLELEMTGAYQMLAFQLQPYAVRVLFGVNPKELNDDCFDLSQHHADTLHHLRQSSIATEGVEILAKLIAEKTEQIASEKSSQIQMAIGIVLSRGGKITVKALAQELHLTERTLQRLFMEYIGLPPKQFTKIVQFQQAFNQVSDEAFDKLSEIVFENGYADQSHFIRNFRRFTGGKPSDFKT